MRFKIWELAQLLDKVDEPAVLKVLRLPELGREQQTREWLLNFAKVGTDMADVTEIEVDDKAAGLLLWIVRADATWTPAYDLIIASSGQAADALVGGKVPALDAKAVAPIAAAFDEQLVSRNGEAGATGKKAAADPAAVIVAMKMALEVIAAIRKWREGS